MTVNTTEITSGPYDGDDITDDFSYTFRVESASQLAVYETDDLGVQTLLTLNTHYTVSGVGVDGGGLVTRVAGALPTGYEWYIRSNYDDTQLTAFESQGGFFPDVHETAFDKLTFLIQQIKDGITRSLRLSDSDSSVETADLSLPLATERASKFLAFDSNGNPIASSGTPDTAVAVSAFMETMLGDADAQEALATLGIKKGSDVASAAALVLGSGDVFDVTGTTAITSINTVHVGKTIILHFDGVLTLTHHATDLILPRAQNITTFAGAVISLYEYATGKWEYVSGNVARDISLGSDANGDIYYRDAGILKRLPKGNDDDVLVMSSGLPAWQVPFTTGANILSDPELVGSGLSVAGGANLPALTALTNTDVAFIDFVSDELRTYRFNGSTWSLVGSGFSITLAGGISALAALNSTDVAFINASQDELRTYRFNGSTWSLVGSGFSLSCGSPTLTALNSTDVAFIDDTNKELRTYRFNGSTWSQVGNGLALANGYAALTALNSTDVAFIDLTNDELRTYRFNGSTWSLMGIGLSISTVSAPAIATLNGTDIAFIDGTNDELRKYRFKYIPGLPYNPSRSL